MNDDNEPLTLEWFQSLGPTCYSKSYGTLVMFLTTQMALMYENGEAWIHGMLFYRFRTRGQVRKFIELIESSKVGRCI